MQEDSSERNTHPVGEIQRENRAQRSPKRRPKPKERIERERADGEEKRRKPQKPVRLIGGRRKGELDPEALSKNWEISGSF